MWFFDNAQEEITERYKALLDYLKDSRTTYTYAVEKDGAFKCFEENGKWYCSLPGVSKENLQVHIDKIQDKTFITVLGISKTGNVYKDVLEFTGAKDYTVNTTFRDGLLEISFD